MPPSFPRYLFWAALLLIFAASLSPAPPQPVAVSDKIQHLAAFAMLTAIGRRAYPNAKALALGAALAGFGALIEFAQMTPGLGRHASFADWLADAAGIGLILGGGALIRRLRPGDSEIS